MTLNMGCLDLASLTLKMGAIFKYGRVVVVERKLATFLSFLYSLYFQWDYRSSHQEIKSISGLGTCFGQETTVEVTMCQRWTLYSEDHALPFFLFGFCPHQVKKSRPDYGVWVHVDQSLVGPDAQFR